ncbi:DUF2252 domain-containing protein [Limobrevibacterium gyesilva]|uniref:DUF2252 domain-containing protein n=1 Tax=Limobrevibacterium gyesilva TaxID=2991712 RepID=A0AA41YU91_9PROT|nr:DUF2252 domain-containing protein [Limobrevibacterium gyesilva]MCW3476590.1 DUF2252 domain-containing protein [Limobrevibacterium gyesilva]
MDRTLDVPGPVAPKGPALAPSPKDRAAAGKALRDRVPRIRHAAWKKAEGRADPIDLLHAADADRVPELVPIRYGRMLQSPFAFYRGAAGVMAADLAETPNTGIKVQACGDCHLMNFGGFATPERNVIFDINDFDETLPAPWEWDIKRLAASIVLAARANGLSAGKGRDAAVACARSYRKRLREFSQLHPLEVWYARVTAQDVIETLPPNRQAFVQQRLDKAMKQSGSEMDFPKLAGMVGGRIGIRDTPPLIFHPDTARVSEFEAVIEQVLVDYRKTLSEDRRALLDRYRYVDAALKVVGIGSVGRRCWIALMMSESNHPLFLQFKEAVESVLEPYAEKSEYPHHGQRVVMGQRLMQPASDLFLGWVTNEATGKQFYARQLRDAKIKPLVETFDTELMTIYAKTCGWSLARAHAKAGDACTISGYLGTSDQFEEAMGDFATAYADQAERDHAALKSAVRRGKVIAFQEA